MKNSIVGAKSIFARADIESAPTENLLFSKQSIILVVICPISVAILNFSLLDIKLNPHGSAASLLSFYSLYSGSTGNSLLLKSDNCNILIDSGVSAKKRIEKG